MGQQDSGGNLKITASCGGEVRHLSAIARWVTADDRHAALCGGCSTPESGVALALATRTSTRSLDKRKYWTAAGSEERTPRRFVWDPPKPRVQLYLQSGAPVACSHRTAVHIPSPRSGPRSIRRRHFGLRPDRGTREAPLWRRMLHPGKQYRQPSPLGLWPADASRRTDRDIDTCLSDG